MDIDLVNYISLCIVPIFYDCIIVLCAIVLWGINLKHFVKDFDDVEFIAIIF